MSRFLAFLTTAALLTGLAATGRANELDVGRAASVNGWTPGSCVSLRRWSTISSTRWWGGTPP